MSTISSADAKMSILDDLGEEVTGVLSPVSLCMAVTVLLVKLLNPDGKSSSNTVYIASIAYTENSSDTAAKKFGGALLNALIFVGVIAGMTVLLLVLFYFKFYKIIFGYMGFAVFNIFFFITGALFINVMSVINLHIDAFSLAYGLFNFSVVGTLGLLFMPMPLLAKQIYLIWVGIITAYIFTYVPSWTSWTLLAIMALYDIAAVLIPGGPLNALVNLAVERNQELPALVYESRPARGRPYVRGWGNRARREGGDDTPTSQPDPPAAAAGGPGATRVDPPPSTLLHRAPGAVGEAASPAIGGWISMQSSPAARSSHTSPSADTTPHDSHVPFRMRELYEDDLLPGAQPAAGGTLHPPLPPPQAGIGRHRASLGASNGFGRGPGPLSEGREDSCSPDAWQALPHDPHADSQALAPKHAQMVGDGGGLVSTGGMGAGALSSHPLSRPSAPDSSEILRPLILHAGPCDAQGMASPGSSSAPGVDDTPAHGRPTSGSRLRFSQAQAGARAAGDGPGDGRDSGRLSPRLVPGAAGGPGDSRSPVPPGGPARAQDADSDEFDFPDTGIKLGLGDFIFYSMLVGKAAQYDFMTVFASFIAVLAGLGLTLLCLVIFQRPLPALPFSIALGIMFYFLTRLVLEPFMIPLATNYFFF